jgi:hypothetical protein
MSTFGDSSRNSSPLNQQPAEPVEFLSNDRNNSSMSNHSHTHPAPIMRHSSGSSSHSSLKSPRTARFAEETTVISPVAGHSPFADPSSEKAPQPHVSDVGFGYVADSDPSRHAAQPPLTPASPLKSALKTPGTARTLNPLSPTFRQELRLEKEEKKSERQNARDLVGFPHHYHLPPSLLILFLENQSPSTNGQGYAAFCELWLQLDRAFAPLD